MPRIPVYQQQTAPTGGAPSVQARVPAVDGSLSQGLAVVGRGLEDLQQGLQAQDLLRRREQEDDAAVSVGKQVSDGRAFWLEQVRVRADGYNPGDPATPHGSLQHGVLTDFDKWQADELSKAPTARSRTFLAEQLGRLRGTLQNETFTLERAARIDHQVASVESSRKTDQDTVYQYPALRAEVLGQRVAVVSGIQGISEQARARLVVEERDGINLAYERGELDRSPERWYEERFGAPFGGRGGRTGAGGATGEFSAPAEFNFPMEMNDATRRWIGPVNAAAERAGVDQNVLLAMVYQESRGDPKAVSRKNARGLLQLMPVTARELKVADPHDPQQAIDGGARYMAQMLSRFGGDYAKALGAYNGGATRVAAAVERARKSGGTWQDYMPAESRDYVARILANVRAPGDAGGADDGGDGATGAVAPPARTAEPRDGPPSWLGLSYDQREALRRQAEQLIGQRQVSALAALRDRVANAQAMARAGLVDPVPIDRSVFDRAGPDGAALGRVYEQSQRTARVVGSMEDMPTDEIGAAVRAAAPAAGEGFASRAANHQAVVAAASAVLERRAKDPAAAVLAYHVPARAAWEAVQKAGPGEAAAAATAYAAVMEAEQERLKLPNAGRLVPQEYADQVVGLFTQAVPAGRAAEQVVALERQWGRYWPRVLAQAGKDLPAAVTVLADVDSAAVREQIARVAAVKVADLKAGLDPADVKAGELAVATDGMMESLRLSLDPTEDGVAVFGRYVETVERLTLANQRAGMKPNAAARDAIDKVLGDKYEVRAANSPRPFMVPRSERPDLVEAGTRAVLDRLGSMSLMLPADRLGLGTAGELPPAEIKRLYVAALRDHAVWVRTPDDDGLQLYGQGADGRLRQVLTSAGRPVQFSWQDLRMEALNADPGRRAAGGRIGGPAFVRPADGQQQEPAYLAP